MSHDDLSNPGDFGLLRLLNEVVLRQPPGALCPEEVEAMQGALEHVADYCGEIRQTDFAEMTEEQVEELFRRFLMHYRRKVQKAALEDYKAAAQARVTPPSSQAA